MQLRVFNIIKTTKAEGPGTRYCIWVQGCSKHCKGCWAKATWDFKKGIKYKVLFEIDMESRRYNVVIYDNGDKTIYTNAYNKEIEEKREEVIQDALDAAGDLAIYGPLADSIKEKIVGKLYVKYE